MGRIIYATLPEKLEFMRLSGKRNCLLSAYYINKSSNILKEWWEYVYPKLLFIDSGVHTFKTQLGITNVIYSDLSQQSKKRMVAPQEVQKNVKKFATEYIEFLVKNENYFSYAFELDVDEFMGIEVADNYYNELVTKLGYEKIIKIWHTTRTFDDWIKWCKNPKMLYLCLEGGSRHNWDPDFYRPFIKEAKKYNKKVHVLAATSAKLFRNVDIDSGDSSSWRTGARFGTITVPEFGKVSFGKKITSEHYLELSEKNKTFVDKWLKEINIPADKLLNNDPTGELKNVANLYYYDQCVDVPYKPKPQKGSIL